MPFSRIKNDARVILTVVAGGRPEQSHCPQIDVHIWEMLEKCWDHTPTERPLMSSLSQFFASHSDLLTTQLARL
jgi:hypothetical protein